MASAGSSALIVAGREHVIYCFDVLTSHFSGDAPDSPAFAEAHCPLFVTWNKAQPLSGVGSAGYRLRGCIGTLEPRYLRTGLRDYALTSALRDHRFGPMAAREVPALRCTVSLLCCFERAAHWLDWQVGVHGLIINFTDPEERIARNATFLPEVAAHEGWTAAATVDALIRKAGYGRPPSDALRMSLSVTRYQSTACTMTYDEYLSFRSGVPVPEHEAVGVSRTITVPA